jgi:para-aminobenzoate synthetase/4-amino-4-deoxychorismate lyase
VILTNDRGEITETTRANVAVRIDGTWWTPPAGAGLLPGCERAALLREGTLAERRITVEELQDAEAIAVLSSVRPWREAVLVDPALRS